jgi:hypothetical protein
MASQKKGVKQNAPRGHSRAAQNRKLRRDALREELQAREYVRQVLSIATRLDPASKNACEPERVPALKARADIFFRLLDKCLPNLRPVDLPVTVNLAGETLTAKGKAVIDAVGRGELPPSDAASILAAITSQARVTEIDDLERRVQELEALAR